MLVRTWNVFHGNASPPERQAFLDEMVRLAVADAPAIVCLQELPVWSLRRLADWSGMIAVTDVTERPSIGPLPSTAELGRVLTDINHGLFRSAFTGQANAMVIAPSLRAREHRVLVLNPWSFRRTQERRLGLGLAARVAWGRERRLCQVVRLKAAAGTLVVGNLHATGYRDRRLADAELLRAASFVDGFAEPAEPIVLAGDFNVTVGNSRTLAELAREEWGFGGATAAGIDHVLVRGVPAGPAEPWPVERRRVGGRTLSDHAPVDRELA